jgi:hypothetical protein
MSERINISAEIMGKINKGICKTVDVIEYLLINTNATTKKAVTETALKDLNFDGTYYKKGYFDSVSNTLTLYNDK